MRMYTLKELSKVKDYNSAEMLTILWTDLTISRRWYKEQLEEGIDPKIIKKYFKLEEIKEEEE